MAALESWKGFGVARELGEVQREGFDFLPDKINQSLSIRYCEVARCLKKIHPIVRRALWSSRGRRGRS